MTEAQRKRHEYNRMYWEKNKEKILAKRKAKAAAKKGNTGNQEFCSTIVDLVKSWDTAEPNKKADMLVLMRAAVTSKPKSAKKPVIKKSKTNTGAVARAFREAVWEKIVLPANVGWHPQQKTKDSFIEKTSFGPHGNQFKNPSPGVVALFSKSSKIAIATSYHALTASTSPCYGNVAMAVARVSLKFDNPEKKVTAKELRAEAIKLGLITKGLTEEERRERFNARQRERYAKDPEFRAKCKAYNDKWRTSPKGRAKFNAHQREYMREYSKRPYVKARLAAYVKEYNSRPEVRARRREYERRRRALGLKK